MNQTTNDNNHVRRDFVDMAELLRDNMEVERRAGGEGEPSLTRRREVPDILSWLQCFSMYAAVLGAHYPEKMKELLAYQALIISEHRRCGGRGWLLYDAAFRKQISNIQEADFSRLNQSLPHHVFLQSLSALRPHPRRVYPVPTKDDGGQWKGRKQRKQQEGRRESRGAAQEEGSLFHME